MTLNLSTLITDNFMERVDRIDLTWFAMKQLDLLRKLLYNFWLAINV